jgi:hypothetical protein
MGEPPIGSRIVSGGHADRKVPCRYGRSCRKLHDREHCKRYEHEVKICKFGAECRRRGRGCRFQHPELDGNNVNALNKALLASPPELDTEEVDGPEPQRPVPFLFFAACISALGLLLLPLVGECRSSRHEELWWVGCILVLPFPCLLLLLRLKRSWLLQQFLEGDYAERATFRKLGCLWYPEHVQILRYTEGELAGNNLEQYATWETNNVQQQVEYVTGGSRDGGQATRVAGSPGSFRLNFPGTFPTCPTTLDQSGALEGLGVEATFDGSYIVSQGGAWSKAGYWRLDTLAKLLLVLLVVGLECIFVAVEMPPGVRAVHAHGRMPLKAVFVVDGSASISPKMWMEGQRANEEFIKAFQRTYSTKPGDLNIGLVQFATKAHVEQPVTHNMSTVLAKLESMPQLQQKTYFDGALSKCRQSLDAQQTEQKSFEVCVLITDGIDMSKKSPSALKSLLRPETAIFGIYVGHDQKGKDELQELVDCGQAQKAGKPCSFFASASDYSELASKAHDVATEVTHGADLAMCAMMSALIGVPTALCMCLPYLLWFASCTGLTMWMRRFGGHGSGSYRTLSNSNSNLSNANQLNQQRK